MVISTLDDTNSSEEELKRLMTSSSHEEEELLRDGKEIATTRNKKREVSPTNGDQNLESKLNLRNDSAIGEKIEDSIPGLEYDTKADVDNKDDKALGKTLLGSKSDELVPGKDQDDNLRSISGASNYSGLLNEEEELRGDDMPPKPKWHPPWQLKQVNKS